MKLKIAAGIRAIILLNNIFGNIIMLWLFLLLNKEL